MNNMNNAVMSLLLSQKLADKYNVADKQKATTTGLVLGMMGGDNFFMNYLLADSAIKNMAVQPAAAPVETTPAPIEDLREAIEYSTNLRQDAVLQKQFASAEANLMQLEGITPRWRQKVEVSGDEALISAANAYTQATDIAVLRNAINYVAQTSSFTADEYARLLTFSTEFNNFLRRALQLAGANPVAKAAAKTK